MLIGLSGKIGSGKSTASEYIVSNYGAGSLSTSNILRSVLESRNLPSNRENLQHIGSVLINAIGGGGFMAIIFEYLPRTDYVIDSIRHIEALQYLRRRFGDGFCNIYVDSDLSTRYQRKKGQYESLRRFQEIDNAESESEIETLRELSNVVITNDESLEDLYIQIRDFLDARGIKVGSL